MTQYSNHKLLN